MKHYKDFLSEANVARSSKITKDDTSKVYNKIEKSLNKLSDSQLETLVSISLGGMYEISGVKKIGTNKYKFLSHGSPFDDEDAEEMNIQFKRVADRVDIYVSGKKVDYIDMDELVGSI